MTLIVEKKKEGAEKPLSCSDCLNCCEKAYSFSRIESGETFESEGLGKKVKRLLFWQEIQDKI